MQGFQGQVATLNYLKERKFHGIQSFENFIIFIFTHYVSLLISWASVGLEPYLKIPSSMLLYPLH